MTAMFGLPAALLVGLILGLGARQLLLAGAIWYAALAAQTAYLSQDGKTGFGGKAGLETVHWWFYWAVQPVLLLLAAGLVWLGSKARERVVRQVRSRTSVA